MRQISLLVLSLILAFQGYSQTKEIIKIDVIKGCSKYVSKRQYAGESYSKPLEIIKGMYNKANMTFAYKENRRLIYFTFNDDMLKNYDLSTINLTIDGKTHAFEGLLDFQKVATVNGWLDEVQNYYLGYELKNEIIQDLNSSSSLSISMIKTLTKKRKVWDFGKGLSNDIREAYNCFEKHAKPIEDEYIASLKTYDTNFRNSIWKSSKEQVIKTEKAELQLKTEDALSYKVKLNNDKFHALYYFNNNLFYQGVYSFKGEFVNENNYYSKYNSLSKILEKKYGKPRSVNKYRSGDLFKDLDDIGMAIKTGRYSETRIWETKQSLIELYITGENFDVSLTIRYRTKDSELIKVVKNKIEEESTEGF